ncbi:HEAT repeat domain-containing protein [Alienimonas californiensis]|uniref:PBS lyase HEAT-like repeat protein n=1 Tax=Alienimonas californiensis TaxID=2527989 RepID=A0A517PC99_9PLAN|nr:HEAT repeat domain-containing protein [Alienimonas californiensis]QDT16971.1 PBS lyase HEAT-like repeat protein [Alienimonas californiensis]
MFASLPLAAALLLAAPPPGDGFAVGDPPTVAGRTAERWAADLSDENRIVRNRAVLSLRAFGAAGAPHLAEALRHEDEAMRFWAAEGLGMTPAARAAKEALSALRTMLQEGAVAERLAAAFAVARLGEPERAVPVLVEGLKHPSRGVAVTSADFLARLGAAAAPAADALREAAENHEDYHVRYRSAQALAAVTGSAPTKEQK